MSVPFTFLELCSICSSMVSSTPSNFVYFSANVDLYKVLVKELSQVLETQFAGNLESRAAGMVINTMGWTEGVGYEVFEFITYCSHVSGVVIGLLHVPWVS